jgi:putative spermidine/putrescine transport system ATP-binding protein
VGAEVDLVLRPEKVALGAAAHGCTNRFAARVVEATFLGDQLRVRLSAFARDDFVLKLPNAAGQGALEAGSAVEIGWRIEDCRALAR